MPPTAQPTASTLTPGGPLSQVRRPHEGPRAPKASPQDIALGHATALGGLIDTVVKDPAIKMFAGPAILALVAKLREQGATQIDPIASARSELEAERAAASLELRQFLTDESRKLRVERAAVDSDLGTVREMLGDLAKREEALSRRELEVATAASALTILQEAQAAHSTAIANIAGLLTKARDALGPQKG